MSIAKEIGVAVVGLLISVILIILSPSLSFLKFTDITFIYLILTGLAVVFLIVIWAINQKIAHLRKEMETTKLEIKSLNESLKIYERLSKIEAELKYNDKK